MKRLLGVVFVCAMFSTPLFAGKLFAPKGTTVKIPDAVTVGAVQIAAGEYKVSYEGSGPAVKVTLLKSGSSPVILSAKLVQGKNNGPSVTIATENGARILQQMDVKGGTLLFEAPESADQ